MCILLSKSIYLVHKQVLILLLLTQYCTTAFRNERDTDESGVPEPPLTDLEREKLENGGDLLHVATDHPKCSSCPPGYGVVYPCNATTDTQCAPCPGGTYQDSMTLESPCIPCSTCPQWYYERIPCTSFLDVACTPCFKNPDPDQGGGYGNEDFLIKCERKTPPPPSTSTEASTSSPVPVHPEIPQVPHITDVVNHTTVKEHLETTTYIQEEKVVVLTHDIEAKDRKVDIQFTTAEENTTHTIGIMGAPITSAATFQWPILLAAIFAALIFFLIGAIISHWLVKKRRERKEALKINGREPEVQDQMLPVVTGSRIPNLELEDYTESPSPGRKPLPDPQDTPPSKYTTPTMRRKPKWSFLPHFLRKKSFYNSQELRYIDEDSDDEIVKHLGRPPSVHFSDIKSEKKPSFLTRLKRSFSTRSTEDSLRDPAMKRLSRTSEDEAMKRLSRTSTDEATERLSRTSEDTVVKRLSKAFDAEGEMNGVSNASENETVSTRRLSRTSDDEEEKIVTDAYV